MRRKSQPQCSLTSGSTSDNSLQYRIRTLCNLSLFVKRRGKEAWPENCEIVDMKRAGEMLEKAKEQAEEAIRQKKKDAEDAEVGKKAGAAGKTATDDASKGKASKNKTTYGGSGGSYGGGNEDYSYGVDSSNDPQYGSEHPEAHFEKLSDGSYAYILKPGIRLKLNLRDILEGGDATKEEREKKKKANQKKFGAFTYGGKTGTLATGAGGDFDDDFYDMEEFGEYGGGGGYGMYTFKHYLNAYTITIDMKLLDDHIPIGGFSLYQTALIHSSDNKRAGKAVLSSSNGECLVSTAGGVGMFGTFGDTSKARLEPNQWKRVVISVKCGSGESNQEKGEMRTWVNSEPCVMLKEDTIQANDRFSIDTSGLFMFSSIESSMMPGNIAIRTIRVEDSESTDESVKAGRATDKV
jgi:hypothetical protein